MNASFGGLFNDPLVGIGALLALALVGFLAGQALAEHQLQRSARRQRERIRRSFWGYE